MYLKQAAPYVSNQKMAAVAHCDGAITMWDITAGKRVSEMFNHKVECRSVEFSCDNKWMVSSSFDCSVGVMNYENRSFVKVK
jgi:WD40 repeat protein